MNLKFHISSVLSFLFISILFFSCGTTSQIIKEPAEDQPLIQAPEPETAHKNHDKDTINLLFAGDIMAHSVNYYITTYDKIWRDVREVISESDLAFANIEAPVDTTKAASSYPNFNMTRKYVQAAVDAGFDVFSLCNNHTNDQYKNGILETIKTSQAITEYTKENFGNDIYFSGTKETADSKLSALIESGSNGIDNLDYKNLAEDLLENE